jgi:hypothetical protein
LWEAWRRDLEVGMESCEIGYAHAETAEPGEQAETHVRFRDVIGLPLTCMTPEKFRHSVGSRGGLRRVLDAIGWGLE